MKKLREAHNMGPTDFAAWLGISKQRWSNVEHGLPLSIAVADRLCERIPGLTLDWLYYGKVDGLAVALARRLARSQGERNA